MDAERFRADSRDRWESGARGWAARREAFQAATEPVSRWLVDAVDPQPGQVVLDLAAGIGDTGFLAAPRLEPGGRLICTDGAEAMVEAARERARELGLENVEFRTMEAEWIDLGTAEVDAVLCRWGYMLLADPEAALRETRRVLKPGGRVALAAWGPRELNPWQTTFGDVLVELGVEEPPDPQRPSMFSFAAPGTIEGLLDAAGFLEWRVEPLDFEFSSPSFHDWWEYHYDLSPQLGRVMERLSPERRDAVYEAIERGFEPFAGTDGSLRAPAQALVAVAEA